jgi:hypothetical protein
VATNAGAHDGGKPVRAEVADNVARPLQFFQKAERGVALRPGAALLLHVGGHYLGQLLLI